ncbi:hypothetical protein [Photobacterium kishitanii]|uniref:hypothetical protein n=1 Tax=Photobacterium kishitanii TaxID=318456 RepID=UPI00273A0F95|nr:hypothetical protein [Photobacterium kishitanii]
MKRILHYFILLLTLLFVTTGCEVVRWKTEHDQSSLKKEGFSKHQMTLTEGGQLTYWEGGQGQPYFYYMVLVVLLQLRGKLK